MRRLVPFVAVVQSILFLTHWFLYATWVHSSTSRPVPGDRALALVLGILSVTFVAASVLSFRWTTPLIRAFYRASAVWMGFLSFLFVGAGLSWLVLGLSRIAGLQIDFHRLVQIMFALGMVTGVVAIFNASCTRVTRATVRLANLPLAWRGRTAALISDVHLGHVRNRGFLRRMVAKITRERPDAIFIAGDLYDGTAIDAGRAAEPLSALQAEHGVYFVAGNHEQFGDDRKYLNAISAAGVRVLSNEKVDVDGLQIVGVPYRSATQKGHLAAALKNVGLDRNRASILLVHAPDHPDIAEAAGISLQLSGHTHLGQFVPWSWFARRIYRQFVYGLSRIGNMQVFTSSGAGTWGPPLRLGSNPEIVMLQFE